MVQSSAQLNSMPAPRHMQLDPARGLTRLWFDGATEYDGEYHMVGGLAWPRPEGRGVGLRVEGYALLLGYHLGRRMAFELSGTRFVTIDHHLGRMGEVRETGLCSWFNRMWSTYGAGVFWTHEAPQTDRKYVQQIARCPMIQPRPRVRRVEWGEDAEVFNSVWLAGQSGTFRGRPDSPIREALERAEPEQRLFPAPVLALMCALEGLVRHPWRERTAH